MLSKIQRIKKAIDMILNKRQTKRPKITRSYNIAKSLFDVCFIFQGYIIFILSNKFLYKASKIVFYKLKIT